MAVNPLVLLQLFQVPVADLALVGRIAVLRFMLVPAEATATPADRQTVLQEDLAKEKQPAPLERITATKIIPVLAAALRQINREQSLARLDLEQVQAMQK